MANNFSLFKRSGKNREPLYYYYCYSPDGRRIWRSTGQDTKAKALEVIMQRINSGTLISAEERKEITFKEFSKPFWIWKTCPVIQDRLARGGHYSVSLCEANRHQMLKHISPTFDKKLLSAITYDNVNTWLLNLPKKAKITNNTANKVFNLLKQMLDVAVNRNLIPDNPARKVKNLVIVENKRPAFTLEQVSALFSEVWDDKLSYTACLLASITGMRLGEIRALRKEQIFDDYICIDSSYNEKIGVKSTKSGKTRCVPIPKETSAILREFTPSEIEFVFTLNGVVPVYDTTITNGLKKRMDEIGIDYRTLHLSFHSFRHFFNSRLVAAGVDGEIIRAAIGHESEEMTEHYLHLQISDMEAINKVQNQIYRLIG